MGERGGGQPACLRKIESSGEHNAQRVQSTISFGGIGGQVEKRVGGEETAAKWGGWVGLRNSNFLRRWQSDWSVLGGV